MCKDAQLHVCNCPTLRVKFYDFLQVVFIFVRFNRHAFLLFFAIFVCRVIIFCYICTGFPVVVVVMTSAHAGQKGISPDAVGRVTRIRI